MNGGELVTWWGGANSSLQRRERQERMSRSPRSSTMRLLTLITSLLVVSPALAADKPNVLFIAIDDLRDWVGFLGDKQAKSEISPAPIPQHD